MVARVLPRSSAVAGWVSVLEVREVLTASKVIAGKLAVVLAAAAARRRASTLRQTVMRAAMTWSMVETVTYWLLARVLVS
jgi:hypothetical protein